MDLMAFEKHYTPVELGQIWGFHPSTIIRMFQDESGVLKYSNSTGRRKREYVTLRIPASVATRVHEARTR